MPSCNPGEVVGQKGEERMTKAAQEEFDRAWKVQMERNFKSHPLHSTIILVGNRARINDEMATFEAQRELVKELRPDDLEEFDLFTEGHLCNLGEAALRLDEAKHSITCHGRDATPLHWEMYEEIRNVEKKLEELNKQEVEKWEAAKSADGD